MMCSGLMLLLSYHVFNIGEIAFHLDRAQFVYMGDADTELTIAV